MSEKFRDVLIRAGKTFIQSFCGVLIPELCMVLSKAVPEATFWTVSLPPLFCAALAAGISAAWNLVSIALSPDVPVLDMPAPSNLGSSVLDVYERVRLDISAFELAADELAASDYSASALADYAVASSQLAASALVAFNLVSPWFPAD